MRFFVKYILLPALLMVNIITVNVHAMFGDLSIEESGATTGVRQTFDPLTIGESFKDSASRVHADYEVFVKSCATKELSSDPIEVMAEIYLQVAMHYNDLAAIQFDFVGALESSGIDTLDETTSKFREISISDARKVYEKYGQYAVFLGEHSIKAKRLIMFLEAIYASDSGLPRKTKPVTYHVGVNHSSSDFDADLTTQQTFFSTAFDTEWKLVLSEDIRVSFSDELDNLEALVKRFDPYSSLINRIFPTYHHSYMYRDFIQNHGSLRSIIQNSIGAVAPFSKQSMCESMQNIVKDYYYKEFTDQVKHIEEQFRQYVKRTIDRLEEERRKYLETEEELVQYDVRNDDVSDDEFRYIPDYNDGFAPTPDPMASSIMVGASNSPNLGLAGHSANASPTQFSQSDYDGDDDR
jgi:hypothetical protein